MRIDLINKLECKISIRIISVGMLRVTILFVTSSVILLKVCYTGTIRRWVSLCVGVSAALFCKRKVGLCGEQNALAQPTDTQANLRREFCSGEHECVSVPLCQPVSPERPRCELRPASSLNTSNSRHFHPVKNSQRRRISLTVYSRTPETLHALRGEETTHMNSSYYHYS